MTLTRMRYKALAMKEDNTFLLKLEIDIDENEKDRNMLNSSFPLASNSYETNSIQIQISEMLVLTKHQNVKKLL